MSKCIEAISKSVDPPLAVPGSTVDLDFGSARRQIVKVQVAGAQVFQFQFNFDPLGSYRNFTISVGVYGEVEGKLTNLGSSSFGDLVGSFSKEFQPGTYYLCIHSRNSFKGKLNTSITGFKPEARFLILLPTGDESSFTLQTQRKANPCNQPLKFQLLEGTLPPGIELLDIGRLIGVLPILDCLDDAMNFSPSFNWDYKDMCGRPNPWGRQWRFKVRVDISEGGESEGDERWFCIRIHNNWDFDKENFRSQMPFIRTREIEVIRTTPPLPNNLCFEPCPEPPKEDFAPEIPIPPDCPGCTDADVVTDIQLIEIPSQIADIPVNQLPIWWKEQRDRDITCPELKKFIESLTNSEYFQQLVTEPEQVDSRVQVEISSFKNFVQLSAMALIEGRNPYDLDFQMIESKAEQNKALPMSFEAWEGVKIECQIQW